MSKVKSRYMDIKFRPNDKKSTLQYLNDSLGVNGEEIDYIERQLMCNITPQQSTPQAAIPVGKHVFKAVADQIINPMITNFMFKEANKHYEPIVHQKEIKLEPKPRYENYSYRLNKPTNDSFSNEANVMNDLLRVHKMPLEHSILDYKQKSIPKIQNKRLGNK